MHILKKLQFDHDREVLLLHCPEAVLPQFSGLEPLHKVSQGHQAVQVLMFAESKSALNSLLSVHLRKLSANCVFWVAYPKKSGSIQSDLSRETVREILSARDWEAVTSISIDEDWPAFRFRHRSQTHILHRLPPPEQRSTEGIDYVMRTAVLPGDALEAMRNHAGLSAFFESLSFSHKKEYIESIVTAKKPETRSRRIEKMITMLEELRNRKQGTKNKKHEL